MYNPVVVVVKEDVVNDAIGCLHADEAEAVFRKVAAEHGVDVTDADLDNGFVMIEMGSICIIHPRQDEE